MTTLSKIVIPAWIAGIQAPGMDFSLPSMALDIRFPASMMSYRIIWQSRINENERRIWPKWLFHSKLSILTASLLNITRYTHITLIHDWLARRMPDFAKSTANTRVPSNLLNYVI